MGHVLELNLPVKHAYMQSWMLPEAGMGADLLSHEATFSSDMLRKAQIAQHSTARSAGAFAARLCARTLVLTHFSNRYSFEGSRPAVRGQLLAGGMLVQ